MQAMSMLMVIFGSGSNRIFVTAIERIHQLFNVSISWNIYTFTFRNTTAKHFIRIRLVYKISYSISQCNIFHHICIMSYPTYLIIVLQIQILFQIFDKLKNMGYHLLQSTIRYIHKTMKTLPLCNENIPDKLFESRSSFVEK